MLNKSHVPCMLALLCVGSLNGCADDKTPGRDAPVRCDLTDYATMQGLDGSVRVCGDLKEDASRKQLDTASRCVAEALDAGAPFSLIRRLRGTDSEPAAGFRWPGSGPVYSFAYDSDPSGGGGDYGQIRQSTCTTFLTTTCPAAGNDLCLSCRSEEFPQTVCP